MQLKRRFQCKLPEDETTIGEEGEGQKIAKICFDYQNNQCKYILNFELPFNSISNETNQY